MTTFKKWLKILKQNTGSSLVGSVIVMTMVALGALTTAHLMSTDTQESYNEKHSQQSETIVNACLQSSLSIIKSGGSPDVYNKSFAQGKYTAVTDPDSSLITCTATVGGSSKTRTINADFSRDCFELNVNDAYAEGNQIYQMGKITKNCNKKGILTKVHLSWNWSDCAIDLNCDGTQAAQDIIEESQEDTQQFEDVGEPPNGKFWICHVPPGNPENAQTLAVNIMGWMFGHSLGKGNNHNMDYLGPCVSQSSDSNQDDDTQSEVDAVLSCAGDSSAMQALEICLESDGGAQVNSVSLDNNVVFQPGSIPSNESSNTNSGIETDILDSVLEVNGEYVLDFGLTQNIPTGAWFTLTTEFADGSSLTGTIKIGNVAPPESDTNTNDDTPGYDIVDNVVIVDPSYQVDLQALGSAITCGQGGTEISVRAQLCINDTCENLWGYTDIDGGETYSTINTIANSEYVIRANAYASDCYDFSQTFDSTHSTQVKVLKNLDTAPSLEGFGGQQSVQEFLQNYINEDGYIVLDNNQVIFLFELGVTDPQSTAADYQDLVVVMTITEVL